MVVRFSGYSRARPWPSAIPTCRRSPIRALARRTCNCTAAGRPGASDYLSLSSGGACARDAGMSSHLLQPRVSCSSVIRCLPWVARGAKSRASAAAPAW